MKFKIILFCLGLASTSLLAQTSTNFQLEESSQNQGGHPADGQTLSSSSFSITLDSLGEGPSQADGTSTSFQLDSGLVADNPPPGEVVALAFSDTDTLTWTPEDSTGAYSLFRGSLSDLPSGYGTCLQSGLTAANTDDADTPTSGVAFFYLVNAENRLEEAGNLGSDSAGAVRTLPSPCP